MRLTNSGNLGIGTSTPNAPLQFPNTIVNRKIVLWEDFNNDHQFFGLESILIYFVTRYQTQPIITFFMLPPALQHLMNLCGFKATAL